MTCQEAFFDMQVLNLELSETSKGFFMYDETKLARQSKGPNQTMDLKIWPVLISTQD
jgi:hypothetical protein